MTTTVFFRCPIVTTRSRTKTALVPLVLACVLSGSGAVAAPVLPVQIKDLKTSGHCQKAPIKIAKLGDAYYLKAAFDGSMTASTDPGVRALETRRCTMEFSVQLAPGHAFDFFQFTVDGIYQISDKGTGRLTVSNRAGQAPAIRTTGFYSLAGGNEPMGELVEGGFAGSLTASQLEAPYRGCGATIPFETSLFITVNQPSSDSSGVTLIDLDEGRSTSQAVPPEACRDAYCLGRLRIKRC